jgi:hypothetical protein
LDRVSNGLAANDQRLPPEIGFGQFVRPCARAGFPAAITWARSDENRQALKTGLFLPAVGAAMAATVSRRRRLR